MSSSGILLKETIIWDKGRAEPAIRDGVLNSQFEFILVFCKDINYANTRRFTGVNFKRGGLNNIWTIPKNRGKSGYNRAAFPLELPVKIVKNFTKRGDLIIDPFMGTGTTGVACVLNNRKFKGIDVSRTCFAESEKNIRQYT